MSWYTFGQMLEAIELGQIAVAADGIRRMKLTPEGLVWLNGPYAGNYVQIRSYLFSDIWTLAEEDGDGISTEERKDWRRKRTEMLENQWLEQRERRYSPPDIEE
ncbi:hypothetical protein B9G55_18560 [Saccharibacillus sp. O16]|nr:hypothetical protein B9G55_18560 [Saccharibacillus sp. O16]